MVFPPCVFRRCLAPGLLLAAVLTLPAPASAVSESGLRSALAAQMRHAGAAASVYVVRADGDQPIYSLRADRPLMPASVNKLYTTSTALDLFGPGERIETTALAKAPLDDDGVLKGNLYLKGGGDPGLNASRIDELADALVDAGLTRIAGNVLGDESFFDQLRGSTNTGGRLDSEVTGQLGALVTARGYAAHGWQKRPAAVAADALRSALEKRDIDVRAKHGGIGTAPPDATEIAHVSSAPMSTLIKLTNTPSDNYYAEMLLKLIGATYGDGGTTRAGAEVVQNELTDLDIRPTIVDGSGLSRSDRTTTRMVVQLLLAMAGGENGEPFLDSLAVTGRSGTVQYRMRTGAAAGRCQVKTGTLHDVSNVAGICTTASGEQVAFAILMNAINPTTAHVLQDRMVTSIAGLR
jgi:D-alanyl-D-alanine carboxypeptidase/D-alanyl-D-alanine-endopeptidase (penicillin-binding protein 4)